MRIVFFGSPDFAVPALAAVAERHEVVRVVTQPDRPAGRGAKLQPPAVKVLATQLGLSVLQPAKLRDGVVARELASLAPDLALEIRHRTSCRLRFQRLRRQPRKSCRQNQNI